MRQPEDATGATHTIAGALLTVGESAEAVADVLRAYGCCGMTNDPHDNPMTSFLGRFGVRDPEVAWNGRGYMARSRAYEQDVSVPLPDPAAIFMAQFDAGQWPELDINS